MNVIDMSSEFVLVMVVDEVVCDALDRVIAKAIANKSDLIDLIRLKRLKAQVKASCIGYEQNRICIIPSCFEEEEFLSAVVEEIAEVTNNEPEFAGYLFEYNI